MYGRRVRPHRLEQDGEIVHGVEVGVVNGDGNAEEMLGVVDVLVPARGVQVEAVGVERVRVGGAGGERAQQQLLRPCRVAVVGQHQRRQVAQDRGGAVGVGVSGQQVQRSGDRCWRRARGMHLSGSASMARR